MEEPRIIIRGQINEGSYARTRLSNRYVYDVNGISPAVIASWGFKVSPAKIIVKDERGSIQNKEQ